MRILPFLALLLAVSTAQADVGRNPLFSLPLHAVVGGQPSCQIPVNCSSIRPTINVPPSSQITVYLLLYFHCEVAGVQTAFSWSPEWTLISGSWNCRGNQISVVTPHGAGGPADGSIVTAFDCVTGATVRVVGYMNFQTGSSGCLAQVQSAFPFGIHVVDCAQGIDQIPDSQQGRLGRICVQVGGVDACIDGPPPPNCDPVPVEPTTWGKIKRTYN
jgi:hypothetical protein